MQYIGYHPGVIVVLESFLLDALVKRCQTKNALLPNLQIISWTDLTDHHRLQSALLRALCAAPSLSLVHMKKYSAYAFSHTNVIKELAGIADARPDLAHLFSTTDLHFQSHSPILSLRSLRSLRVGETDEASFCQIGTFPNLTDLSTAVSSICDDSLPVNEGAFLPCDGSRHTAHSLPSYG